MSAGTGVDALERSIHNANSWLTDLERELDENRRACHRILRAFLHPLRERLTVAESAHLAAQLPHLWRGAFYEGWTPTRVPQTYRDRDTFLRRLAEAPHLAGPTEASLAAQACAGTLRAHIDGGEYRHLLETLPSALVPFLEP